jgi:apolipoprotein D and lipocalin family protein
MKTLRALFFAFFILGSFSRAWASGSQPPLPGLAPVENFQVKSYMGDWYELARKPQWFQKNCVCTQARYTLKENGGVSVLNRCRKKTPSGKIKTAKGKARFETEDRSVAALEVSFFLNFYGQYWVIDLDPDYQWALVSNAPGTSLWVLARDPSLPRRKVDALLAKAAKAGIDVSDVIQDSQKACTPYDVAEL